MSRRRLLFLAILAVLPYLNGLTGDYTYDDKLIIRDNPRIASPARVREIFTTHYFGGPLASGTAYRPLVLLTYAVERWIHGDRVVFFHAVNVLLHAGVTLLLALWLLALGFESGPSLAAAALFAVLTIHVEAVTGLVGRAEVLAALLVLVSALLWLRATEGDRLRRGPWALSLAAFLAGVFVKENAVVVPGVIVLGELFRGGDGAGFRRWLRAFAGKRALAFVALSAIPIAVLFAVRRVVLKGFLISREAGIFDLENPLVALTAPLRIGNAATLVFRYVAKTAVPVGLSADHSAYALPLAARLAEPRAWLGVLGLFGAGLTTLLLWRVRPLAAFGAALFFGTLLPVANLLFPIGTIYAERLAYLPSAGLACLAAGLFAPARRTVPRPSPRAWRELLLVAAILGYAGGTVARNRAFRSDTVLYADMLKKVPNSAKAHYDVGYDAERRGLHREAREHLERAVAIFPRYYDAWALLGKIAWDEKRWDDAIAGYRRSVEISGSYENGRWGLAKTLEEAGRRTEAAQAFADGTRTLPDSYPLAYHYAGFLADEGRLAEAEAEWIRAVKVGKGSALAHLGYARLLVLLGREPEALNEARRALVAERGMVDARLFLAGRYEMAGKTLGASGELMRAWRSAPGDAALAARFLEFGALHPETRGRAAAIRPLIERRFGRRPADETLRAALLALGG